MEEKPIVRIKMSQELFVPNSLLLKGLTQAMIKISPMDCDVCEIQITEEAGIFRITAEELQRSGLPNISQRLDGFCARYPKRIIISEDYETAISQIDPLLICGFGVFLAQKYALGFIPTRSIQDTILCIRSMAMREQIHDTTPIITRIKPRMHTLYDTQQFLIEGLANCGPKKAELLLETLQTPAVIIQNILENPEKITTIKGFGPSFIEENQKLLQDVLSESNSTDE